MEKGITMRIEKISKEREKETQKAFNKERVMCMLLIW